MSSRSSWIWTKEIVQGGRTTQKTDVRFYFLSTTSFLYTVTSFVFQKMTKYTINPFKKVDKNDLTEIAMNL